MLHSFAHADLYAGRGLITCVKQTLLIFCIFKWILPMVDCDFYIHMNGNVQGIHWIYFIFVKC